MGLVAAALLAATPAAAQQIAKPVLPEPAVKTIIAIATQHYWGEAKDGKGNVIAAPTPEAAKLPPIDVKDAYAVVDNAAPTGAAEFCRIEWRSYHDAYLKLAQRDNKWSDEQMLFVERVFKSTHDVVLNALQHGYKCNEDMHQRIAEKLNANEEFVAQEFGDGPSPDAAGPADGTPPAAHDPEVLQ